MIKEIKGIRLEAEFINYLNEYTEVKSIDSSFYAHGTRYVLFISHSERFIKIYYTNLLYTFNGEIPHNYIELIEKQINSKGYVIIIQGKEE